MMSPLKCVYVVGIYAICVVVGTGLAVGNAWGGDNEAVKEKVGELIEAISAGDEDSVKKSAAVCCPLLAEMQGESLKTMRDYFGEIKDVNVGGDKARASVLVPGMADAAYIFHLEKIDGIWVISRIDWEGSSIFK